MPNFPGTVINGKWYAQSPYGPTNASGGVNVAPYGPWNGMPASGFSPVIGTPTMFTTGGTPPTPATSGGGIPGYTPGPVTTPGAVSPDFGLNTLPTVGGSPAQGISQPTTGTPWATAQGANTVTLGQPPTPGATGSFGTGPYQPGASPNLESITDLVNRLNLTAQQTANAGRVPGGQAVENTLMGNTADLAAGRLPADVIAQIQQQSAERGIQTGNSDYLRALGLNSLQAQQTAQGNLSAAYARNPAAPIFDPTTQLLTPGQAGSLNNQLNIENAKLALEWYYALHPELRGPGGRGAPAPSPEQPTSALPSWFPTVGGTPSPGAAPPPTYGGQSYYSGMNPATSDWIDQFWNQATNIPNPAGTSGGGLFGGIPGVGYDQPTNTGYGVGYDVNTADPFNFYGG